MEQRPYREANTHSASKKIPRFSSNLKVYYCVYMKPPLVPVLSQMHPVYIFSPYLGKVHLYIFLTSMPRSSQWSLLFRLSDKKIVWISPVSHACFMPRSSHPHWLDQTIFGEEYKLWRSPSCSLV